MTYTDEQIQDVLRELLDVVNSNDEVIGQASFPLIHRKEVPSNLRHRSVQAFIFEDNSLEKVLVAQRSEKQEISSGKYHPSVGGHVRLGQNYNEAIKSQTSDELFNGQLLPKELLLAPMVKFKNDSRPTNLEIATLFIGIYSGPFETDWENKKVEFIDIYKLKEDVNRDKQLINHTYTLKNSLNHFCSALNKK